MLVATCGTYESNDCFITVKKQDQQEIKIESIVLKQFGKQIKKVIEDTLSLLDDQNYYVHIKDKGALDYTIKARLLTAVKRLEENQ